MDVFTFRDRLIDDFSSYVGSFIRINDPRITEHVRSRLEAGHLWPDPLIQLNPAFAPGGSVDALVAEGLLHPEASRIFRRNKDRDPSQLGEPLHLHEHQVKAIRTARGGHNYVLTTGTGSGKSLTYIIPIVDRVLRDGPGQGVRAIIVYPMNALANSQAGELAKFLDYGFEGSAPVTFRRYTGQESDEERNAIIANPPDILLTNYVMLELLLTRQRERGFVDGIKHLRFLVLDELHTYRGRQGADVAMLVRRVRERLGTDGLQVVGTSATMSSKGTFAERQADVAGVATRLFGAPVQAEHVIGETLQRLSLEHDLSDPDVIAAVRARLKDPSALLEADYAAFVAEPITAWIETTFGVTPEGASGRLVRAKPRTLQDAARALSALTGVDAARCEASLKQLLLAGYRVTHPETGLRVFAFKLHQFISRGDTVYASLESERARYLTLERQQFVPGDRDKVLLPLAFCRECGQPYYTVWQREREGQVVVTPRDLSETGSEAGVAPAYVYLSSTNPWPQDVADAYERLPEDWLEEHRGGLRVRSSQRKHLPQDVVLGADGVERSDGLPMHLLPAPFRFCLNCGVSYPGKQGEFSKLGVLSAEGRASATTVLSLSATLQLRGSELPERARKLLSFTDNRQDASLQAGHLNDFVEVSLLRAALYQAMRAAGPAGLEHDALTQAVFKAMALELADYAANPEVKFTARNDTDKALREVLGYRLYRDLKRGWRLTAPNLEQTGLLMVAYKSLRELCKDQEEWQRLHPALALADPATRERIGKVLADVLRWNLAIGVDYLEQDYQERIKQQASRYLKDPWLLAESETLEYATVAFARGKRPGEQGKNLYLSPRGLFGRYLRRSATFPHLGGRPSLDDTQVIIADLLKALTVAGIVEQVGDAKEPAYRLNAGAMLWRALDGQRAFVDPLRTVATGQVTRAVNAFFRDFYQNTALNLRGVRAHEHTAQVPADVRLEREEGFRNAELPILYCSPTMELGVDISDLNVVNLRNVPPTPANYAQRSGRAGRSGQPALVFTYASNMNAHDQYFFKRPERMVAGVVAPPRLELANEELLRAHVNAVWLSETRADLGRSLVDVLDMDNPDYPLQAPLRADILNPAVRVRALARAKALLASIAEELAEAGWYHEAWLEDTIRKAPERFDAACERWRNLYRSAQAQFNRQNEIIRNAATPAHEREHAKAIRAEAERQMELLRNADHASQSDFYAYRYFASEGFLPGYSFPRLPLSAYIPGRRGWQKSEDYLSRPRFLAISEFGPRAIIYHEGMKFETNRVILPPASTDPATGEAQEVAAGVLKLCETCGYLHPVTEGAGVDVCERCRSGEIRALDAMFRLENVSTKRRERISSDEEERQRLGYEIITGVRFESSRAGPGFVQATVEVGGKATATLQYGQTANLWRINLGWLRREHKHQLGFVLDLERGYWKKDKELQELEERDESDDDLSNRLKRVIPYVQDYRNALIWEPAEKLEPNVLASLQAALKMAIQVEFQLEDSELAAEPLPDRDRRRLILLYEAAEGGAGVLQQLVTDPRAVAAVARRALEICHFAPDTLEDLGHAPHATERCEAACYDCLMSYTNQRDHLLLDRHAIKSLLAQLLGATTRASPTHKPRAQQLEELRRLAGSELEKAFLALLEEHDARLPSAAQKLVAGCGTRPDFLYEEEFVALYIDGPPHTYPERQQRDQAQGSCLENLGYTVLRFRHTDDWPALLKEHAWLFGGRK
jgi:ATP-dependent helicase YprA (DUF1998 family)/very-short-patch-repair endonuclease